MSVHFTLTNVPVSLVPTPAPGLAFVRKIQTAETYGGSAIIVPEQARDKVSAEQWEIVSVGAPEPCDDEDCARKHLYIMSNGSWIYIAPMSNVRFETEKEPEKRHPCDLVPGEWVLVRKRAPVPSPEPDLWIIRQDDCIGRFTVTEDA